MLLLLLIIIKLRHKNISLRGKIIKIILLRSLIKIRILNIVRIKLLGLICKNIIITIILILLIKDIIA